MQVPSVDEDEPSAAVAVGSLPSASPDRFVDQLPASRCHLAALRDRLAGYWRRRLSTARPSFASEAPLWRHEVSR
jgi:hypothetical protein